MGEREGGEEGGEQGGRRGEGEGERVVIITIHNRVLPRAFRR